MNVEIAAIPWYKEVEFAEIKIIMEDGDKLHDNYADWLTAAMRLKKTYEYRGIVAVEAYIDPGVFVAWCRARGLNTDAKARMLYTNLVAKQSCQGGSA